MVMWTVLFSGSTCSGGVGGAVRWDGEGRGGSPGGHTYPENRESVWLGNEGQLSIQSPFPPPHFFPWQAQKNLGWKILFLLSSGELSIILVFPCSLPARFRTSGWELQNYLLGWGGFSAMTPPVSLPFLLAPSAPLSPSQTTANGLCALRGVRHAFGTVLQSLIKQACPDPKLSWNCKHTSCLFLGRCKSLVLKMLVYFHLTCLDNSDSFKMERRELSGSENKCCCPPLVMWYSPGFHFELP